MSTVLSVGAGRRRSVPLVLVAAAAIAAACSEDIQGGAGCPLLCPEQNVVVLDTVLEPVSLDTTVVGYPTTGTESWLVLARDGDVVDVRPVVRFDSLVIYYRGNEPDTTIEVVDSSYVRLRVDTALSVVTAPVTIDVFDVDTIVGDSAAAANDTSIFRERLLFRDDRQIGTITLAPDEIGDSIMVPLDNDALLAKITANTRLRLGFRLTSSEPASLLLLSREGGDPPVVRYDPAPDDTAITHLTVLPLSKTPRNEVVLASDLTDYAHVFSAPPVPAGPYVAVGNLPGHRIFLRFDLPSRILDSSNVLRATLLLTQVPAPSPDADSLLDLFPRLVTAGAVIDDPARAAFLANAPRLGFDSIRVAPSDSGEVRIEIVNAVRAWSFDPDRRSQQALILSSKFEGMRVPFVMFFSSEAPPDVRPRLRVSYSPIRTFGVP